MKKSRKAKQFYTLLNKNGNEVQIDLNNYKVTCVATGKRKSFYHKYLAGLIKNKYQNNIDLFRDTYTSREAAPSRKDRDIDRLQARINRLRAQLDQTIAAQKHLINS